MVLEVAEGEVVSRSGKLRIRSEHSQAKRLVDPDKMQTAATCLKQSAHGGEDGAH